MLLWVLMSIPSEKKRIVISVGGSLIVPQGGIDTNFLSRLNTFIRAKIAEYPGRQFFLVAGGGMTTRNYQKAAKEIIGKDIPDDDLDWLGIHSTRLNGHLLRTIFRDIAHLHIIEHYDIIRKATESVVIAAGWKPGRSTDYCAVLLAEDYKAEVVINLSNITQVYDSDPKENKNARVIHKISWKDFRVLVGDTWSPGLNTPFDPIAAKKAESLDLTVVVVDGNNFENLEKYWEGKPFVGTIIES